MEVENLGVTRVQRVREDGQSELRVLQYSVVSGGQSTAHANTSLTASAAENMRRSLRPALRLRDLKKFHYHPFKLQSTHVILTATYAERILVHAAIFISF